MTGTPSERQRVAKAFVTLLPVLLRKRPVKAMPRPITVYPIEVVELEQQPEEKAS